jgi:hypothetical protein
VQGDGVGLVIFETLWASARRGELLLLDGAFCHYHLRRDGQLTIREIISLCPGQGQLILERLAKTPGATSILAKCPADLEANAWYKRRGFHLEAVETTKTGREVNVWRLPL